MFYFCFSVVNFFGFHFSHLHSSLGITHSISLENFLVTGSTGRRTGRPALFLGIAEPTPRCAPSCLPAPLAECCCEARFPVRPVPSRDLLTTWRSPQSELWEGCLLWQSESWRWEVSAEPSCFQLGWGAGGVKAGSSVTEREPPREMLETARPELAALHD